jgi:hypothetical protein
MPRGGKRPGAGRKTNAELEAVHNFMDQNFDDGDWLALFKRLYELALGGSMRAADLLLTYRFGNPYADLPDPEEKEIDKVILDFYSVERERQRAERLGVEPNYPPFTWVS